MVQRGRAKQILIVIFVRRARDSLGIFNVVSRGSQYIHLSFAFLISYFRNGNHFHIIQWNRFHGKLIPTKIIFPL